MRALLPALLLLTACPPPPGEDQLEAANQRIDELEAEIEALRAAVGAIVGYDDGELRGLLDGLDDRLADLESRRFVRLIDEPTTIRVPADHATLSDAMAWLRRHSLAARVTVQIADGTYTHTEGVDLGHRDGALVRIVGNTGDASRVVLQFNGTQDGLYLVRGRGLDGLSGLTIRGDGTTESVGIWVGEGAALRCRGPVVVEGFADGMVAASASSLRCDGAVSRDNARAGFAARRTSSLRVHGSVARDNGGPGYVAVGGSSIEAPDAHASDNGDFGFLALGASDITVGDGAESRGNRMGVGALWGANFAAWGPFTVRDNTEEGVHVGGGASADLSGATVTNNGQFGVNSFWGSFALVSRVVSTGHEIDYNLQPSDDPTRTSEVHRWE